MLAQQQQQTNHTLYKLSIKNTSSQEVPQIEKLMFVACSNFSLNHVRISELERAIV